LWQDGADFLIDIAASPGYGLASDKPGQLSSEVTVNSFLHTYAELMTTFVIYVNRVGIEDGVSFWGGSLALTPNANLLTNAPLFDESLTVADIDVDALRRARLRLPTLRDERRELVQSELERVRVNSQASILEPQFPNGLTRAPQA
jgi:predicted amidohydrolase